MDRTAPGFVQSADDRRPQAVDPPAAAAGIDGGVARLRAYGEVIPDPLSWTDVSVEVSGVEQGGRVEWCSDSHYSDAHALIRPDRPRNMGDGWETRRRRDIGPETHDAVMVSFAAPAHLRRLEIDTSYFVFNASREISVLGSRHCPDGENGWALVPFDIPVLARTPLAADARHTFTVDVPEICACGCRPTPTVDSPGCAPSARPRRTVCAACRSGGRRPVNE